MTTELQISTVTWEVLGQGKWSGKYKTPVPEPTIGAENSGETPRTQEPVNASLQTTVHDSGRQGVQVWCLM